MKVRELIEKLQEMDREKEVWVVEYDGWTHKLSSVSEGDGPQSDEENKVVFVQ